jgi:hypothetical protein
MKAAHEYESRPVESSRSGCVTSQSWTAARPAISASRTPPWPALEPFRPHGTVHTPDGFDRFGCTSCHGGQGPATSAEQAHGTARDAGPPMLPRRRGGRVQALPRCRDPQGAPTLSRAGR